MDVPSLLASVVGVIIGIAWIAAIIAIIGWLAFAGRRRALRRGTYPLRLLPWYLGGPPETPLEHPDDGKRIKKRRRT